MRAGKRSGRRSRPRTWGGSTARRRWWGRLLELGELKDASLLERLGSGPLGPMGPLLEARGLRDPGKLRDVDELLTRRWARRGLPGAGGVGKAMTPGGNREGYRKYEQEKGSCRGRCRWGRDIAVDPLTWLGPGAVKGAATRVLPAGVAGSRGVRAASALLEQPASMGVGQVAGGTGGAVGETYDLPDEVKMLLTLAGAVGGGVAGPLAARRGWRGRSRMWMRGLARMQGGRGSRRRSVWALRMWWGDAGAEAGDVPLEVAKPKGKVKRRRLRFLGRRGRAHRDVRVRLGDVRVGDVVETPYGKMNVLGEPTPGGVASASRGLSSWWGGW